MSHFNFFYMFLQLLKLLSVWGLAHWKLLCCAWNRTPRHLHFKEQINKHYSISCRHIQDILPKTLSFSSYWELTVIFFHCIAPNIKKKSNFQIHQGGWVQCSFAINHWTIEVGQENWYSLLLSWYVSVLQKQCMWYTCH